MTDENQQSPPPAPETPAPDSTAAADPTPTTSGAAETGTAASAAGSSSVQAGPVYQHLRVILQDALAEIGKAEQFTADEIEKLWQAIAAKV